MYKNPTPASPSPVPSPDTSPASTAEAPRRSRLGKFGVLPQLAGTSFLVLGLFARLPLAMLAVGALTLVTTASGSYAVGGFAAGAVGLGSALGAPLLGFLADKRGQRIVLLVSAVLNTLAIAALLVVTSTSAGFTGRALALVLVSSLAMGFTCPQVGPLARVRWMAMTRRSPRSALDTALSYEGTADELTFVLGPALVGLLASLIAPWLPLALAAALTITFVCAFAVHPTVAFSDAGRLVESQVDADGGALGQDGTGASVPRLGPALVLLPVAGMVAMGSFFGSTQTFLTAFTGEFGAAESSGLLYAVMGSSSAIAALSVAYWSPRFRHTSRWMVSAAAMTGAAAALALPVSIAVMVVVLLILGLFVGPAMVTIFSIGSAVAPAHRLGTVMTFLASGIVAGTAVGSALAGTLAQAGGAAGAAMVPGVAAGILLLIGALSAIALRRVSAA
ncbi:MFS transporter [Arthrobacter cheniae]|uniref:MFS transporter n=1 Tax=Arthrobacter cheniae TaxID=1258888 RepID=A0A3A5M992_9MICC|nr:MFS transporter [Arthrobacter cheniae]RJT82103.1 MFS transporter [Arthrobacter cheniae]